MAKLKIKKGDLVQVVTGASQANGGDRGKQGKVIAVYPDSQRVLVEGVNRVKKHERIRTTQRGAKTGGIVTQEAPIHISNVQIVDDQGKPTRIGYRIDDNGQKVRIARTTGKEI
jgi:large subunit ribosomal protein L24